MGSCLRHARAGVDGERRIDGHGLVCEERQRLPHAFFQYREVALDKIPRVISSGVGDGHRERYRFHGALEDAALRLHVRRDAERQQDEQ